ncbi:MFS transporter [Nocardia stercoris]|uniref:MFS transporter n=1 Tax=Nocardia stercoris TaxID=2483361 RepID=A0A3M2KWA2_9NOCA|nr:MFS transporter [Nocardia stercoris]RMI28906.1 MFS transporter [Nocardia stercoris]
MDREGLQVVPEAAGPPVRKPRAAAFRALRAQPFRWYFAGQIASASGTFVQATAIGWMVLQLTGSPSALGLVLATGGIPPLLLGPWGGVLVDRFDLRRLLIGTQAISAALALALWIPAVLGTVSVPLVVAVMLLGGVVQIVDAPARQAIVGRLVPPGDLSSAVSLNGVVMNGARVVGPAIAGVLIATVGTTPCFAINAVSYVAVIAVLFLVRPIDDIAGGHSPGGLAEALRYARSRQQLWLPLAMMGLVGLLSFNFPVVLPVLAERTFHAGGGGYGLLSTVLSVGSVVGSLGVGLIRHPRRIYLVAAATAFGFCLAATAVAPNATTACLALVATGVSGFCFVTLASTAIQLHADPRYRGRIMALWVFVFLGTTPIGSILTGWICDTTGPRAALLVAAAAALIAAAAAAAVHTPPHPDDHSDARTPGPEIPEPTRK